QSRRDLLRNTTLDRVDVLGMIEKGSNVSTEMELVLKQSQQGSSHEVSVSTEGFEELKEFQSRRDLPRNTTLDRVDVLGMIEKRSNVSTEMELVLEQSQQGSSHEVSVSTEGFEELKRITHLESWSPPKEEESSFALYLKPLQHMNLRDPIDIRMYIIHPEPVAVVAFLAAAVVRTQAQHGEAIRAIHEQLLGVPIQEELTALRFRIDIAEAENASLRARIKTTVAIEKITCNRERQTRVKIEQQLAGVQVFQRQDRENFRKLKELMTSQFGHHS
nr:hypothetical protein [Tanacetum cinerariifolium]